MNNKAITKGIGELCPKCNEPMERRKHPEGYFKKQYTGQSYYFSEWDYCKGCVHIQHYEKFKKPFEKFSGVRPINSLFDRLKIALENNKAPSTLFDVEPSWEKLKEQRCPICANKLLFPRNRKIAICYGKSHGDKKSFIINTSKLAQILAK